MYRGEIIIAHYLARGGYTERAPNEIDIRFYDRSWTEATFSIVPKQRLTNSVQDKHKQVLGILDVSRIVVRRPFIAVHMQHSLLRAAVLCHGRSLRDLGGTASSCAISCQIQHLYVNTEQSANIVSKRFGSRKFWDLTGQSL